MPLRERHALMRRLSLYLASGIPLLEAVDLLAASGGSRARAQFLDAARRQVAAGNPLSSTFESFPHAFGPAVVGGLAAGESSGNLPETLARLADLAEREARLRRELLQTLSYPALLLVASVGVCAFLLLVALPRILPLFASLRTELPLATRVLIGVSHALSAYGLWIGLATLGAGAAAAAALRRRRVLQRASRLLLRLPLAGPIVRDANLSASFLALSSLLASGIRLEAALALAARTVRHPAYQDLLRDLGDRTLDGVPLSAAARASDLVPGASADLLATGERSGRLRECLALLARVHEEECAARVALASRLAEPVLIAAVAAFVGFVALAIVSPLYAITQQIQAL